MKWNSENVSVVDNLQGEVLPTMDHILLKNRLFSSPLKTLMVTQNLAQHRTATLIIWKIMFLQVNVPVDKVHILNSKQNHLKEKTSSVPSLVIIILQILIIPQQLIKK